MFLTENAKNASEEIRVNLRDGNEIIFKNLYVVLLSDEFRNICKLNLP